MTHTSTPAGGVLERAGQLAPLHLGITYTGAACIGTTLQLVGARVHSPGLTELGLFLFGAAALALYVVVTWYRDDDALAAGVLLALTLIIGSLAATVVVGVIVSRSITGGIALLTFGPIALVMQAIVLVPVSAVLVWVARKGSAWIEKAIGTPAP